LNWVIFNLNRPFKLKTKANKSPKLTWAQKSQTKAGPTCVRSLRGRLRGPEGPITSPPGLLPLRGLFVAAAH